MSLHSDTLFWFRANQYLLTRQGLEPTIYRARGEDANNYTVDAVKNNLDYSLMY